MADYIGDNSSATGDSNDQSQKQQNPQKDKRGAQGEHADTEPQNSVSGQPSAASYRGSADAVAHRSVAQPGAPQEGPFPIHRVSRLESAIASALTCPKQNRLFLS